MLGGLFRLIDDVQGIVFEKAVEPALYGLGLMDWAEDVFDGVGVALYGALAVAAAYLVLRPLELWRPVERWPERRAVWTDVVYTLVHKLGVVPALFFVVLTPIGAMIDGYLRFQGYIPPTLEQLAPALRTWPFATFLLYVVVLDFGEYWRHRLQHLVPWWWALHSLHHDQRQMTLWSDDRNHLLDDILTLAWGGTLALLIGVEPEEFPLVVIMFRFIESLSHTNVRLGFGRLGGVLLVGPQYHRVHHSIAHAEAPFSRSRGCNFAVILPLWDVIFGTWRRSSDFPATGVAALDGDSVCCGYFHHQWEGLRRLGAAMGRSADSRRPGFAAAFGRAYNTRAA
jgi:sterol desaturase/sphingolipid hydroxylase (fatty acid hydroxylase superfamily)